MAKTKNVKNQNPSKKQPRRRRNRSTPQNNLASRYAMLLHNPDNGDHNFDVYDGERGETQKFVSTITLNNTAGHTCGFFSIFGATGNGQWASGTTSTGALTFALLNTGCPGATFLTANAAKTRCKALKVELIPAAASFSNITGEVAAGVGTSNLWASGVTTVDNLFDVAKASGPIRRETVVSRWIPSGLDHTYTPYNSVPSEDHNSVFVAYRGWPAAVPISVRITYVVEYTVKSAIGIPPTGAVSIPVGHHNVIASLQSHDPHWHHSILDEVKRAGVGVARDVGMFGRNMARAGMFKIAQKYLPSVGGMALALA
nr:MAG: hypothetical protein [Narnaviridae sp.]